MKVTASIIQYHCAISFTLEKAGTAFVKKTKEEKDTAKRKGSNNSQCRGLENNC